VTADHFADVGEMVGIGSGAKQDRIVGRNECTWCTLMKAGLRAPADPGSSPRFTGPRGPRQGPEFHGSQKQEG
jgi:hypothetical protein